MDDLAALTKARSRLLSNLDRGLREPEVLAQAISDNREMWVMLYRVSRQFEDDESRG